MEKIYSKIDPDLLLHVIFRKEDFINGRIDIIEANNFIQCAALTLTKGQTFRPHRHNMHLRPEENYHAQESWTCHSGSFKAILYDINDTIIAEPILKTGDTSFSLAGGHNYLSLEDNTKILEYKTGKYYGQEYDKTFIE